MTSSFSRKALNAALALVITLGLASPLSHNAYAKKKKKPTPDTTEETSTTTTEKTEKVQNKTGRAVSSAPGATFHCVGIGKGHHHKGMTEEECKKAGGTVKH